MFGMIFAAVIGYGTGVLMCLRHQYVRDHVEKQDE